MITSLADLLQFEKYGGGVAFVEQTPYRSKQYSYANIAEGIYAATSAFTEIGLNPGDRVILWGASSARWAMTFYACVVNRIVAVPIDPTFSQEFVDRIAEHTKAKYICSDRKPETWDFLLAAKSSVRPLSSGTPPPSDTLLQIIYTSGTTGDPKGVMITHGNLLSNLIPVHSEIQKYRKFALPFHPIGFVHLIPLSHLFGQIMGLFIPQMLGGKVVFLNPTPSAVVKAVKANRVSAVICVPHELALIRNYVSREQKVPQQLTPAGTGVMGVLQKWWRYRSVHRMFGWKFWAFISGGAALPIEQEKFWSDLGFAVIQGYGLTETAPSVTITHPFKGIKQGAVGKVLPGLEVKMADDGEILVKGPNVSPGYYNNQSASSEVFADGWLRTGDLGRFDEAGNLILTGRKKEMIVLAGGMNVYPQDVESVLNSDPFVRESAVIPGGAPEKPEVHAVIVLRNSNESHRLQQIVDKANSQLEPHQQIRSYSLWSDHELPRTSTGKLKRIAISQGAKASEAGASKVQELAFAVLEGTGSAEEDLGLSSLDRLELMVDLEQKTGIEIDELAFSKAKTVGEVRNVVELPAANIKQESYDPWSWRLWWPVRMFRYALWYLLVFPLMRIRMPVRPEGVENLNDIRHPVLFICNHQSIVDASVVLKALPRYWRHRLSPAMGTARRKIDLLAASLCFNTYPLPVTGVGLRSAIRHTGWLADHGYSPLIFPEGVRTPDGTLQPFRAGIGVIVKDTMLPVVPLFLEGAFDVWPEHARGPAKGKIKVTFGKLISFAGKDPAQITLELEKLYIEQFKSK